MTLIEIVIASTIFFILAAGLLTTINYLMRSERRVRILTSEERLVQNLIMNIRSNVHLYQTNFRPTTTDAREIEDVLRDLPIAFSESQFTSVRECETCPGRMGFVLQPVATMPGLFQVTLRVKHRELYGSDVTRQFRFIASFK